MMKEIFSWKPCKSSYCQQRMTYFHFSGNEVTNYLAYGMLPSVYIKIVKIKLKTGDPSCRRRCHYCRQWMWYGNLLEFKNGWEAHTQVMEFNRSTCSLFAISHHQRKRRWPNVNWHHLLCYARTLTNTNLQLNAFNCVVCTKQIFFSYYFSSLDARKICDIHHNNFFCNRQFECFKWSATSPMHEHFSKATYWHEYSATSEENERKEFERIE